MSKLEKFITNCPACRVLAIFVLAFVAAVAVMS